MYRRELLVTALMTVGWMSILPACASEGRSTSNQKTEEHATMTVHYLEIVTDDADALVGLYQRVHGLTFGPPDPDLGQARVATRADGTLVGIRKPLAAHEKPIVRTYLAVDDIQRAVKNAEASGAVVAYPPTLQGKRGTFAIVVQGGVEHGLWQR